MLDAAPDRITLVANDTSTSYYSDIVEDSYYHKTIAHELTHLLQYQNNFFGHWYEMSYVDEWLRGNNLTEGDACFTMDLYHAEMYNDSVNLDSLVQFERDEVTIFEDYLSRNILGDYHIFFLVSYLYGTQYIAEMYQQYGWDTINTMHMVNDFLPNQLLTDGTVFDEVEVDLSSLDGSVSNRSIFAEDIFGSAILSALLNTYSTSPAQEKIAAFREQYGWRGDKIRMYESEENYCYVWSVVFDSDSSAQRMHDIVHVQNTTKSTESRPLLTLDNSEVINDSTTVYSYSSSGFSSYHLVQGAQMWIVENPVQDIDTILNRIIN